MARANRPGHRPLHPGRRLNPYSIFPVAEGPWPGRLAMGPVPSGDDAASAIAAWGARIVVGLTMPEEAEAIGCPDLGSRFAANQVRWINAPIVDFSVPDGRFEAVWDSVGAELLSRLDAGERILVHCRGGRGRSGMIVAAMLLAGGLPAEAAVAAVRRARPGAIETSEQERWVMALQPSPRRRQTPEEPAASPPPTASGTD